MLYSTSKKEKRLLQCKLLEFIYKKYPYLASSLKTTNHSYDNTFEGQKIYHMEDSVWTHTLLVLQESIHNQLNDYVDVLTSFCHDFGKCISAKSLSQDKFVEQTKERIHRMIQGYKIPVQGYYWYKGSIEAFLGYRSEEISVFMQRANGVY